MIVTDDVSDESLDVIIDLLQVSDMFLSDSRLKEVCSSMITKGVDVDNVAYVFMISRYVHWL